MVRIKLGDIIAKITKALRIPHCKNCERRREILNEVGDTSMREILKKLKHCCDEK